MNTLAVAKKLACAVALAVASPALLAQSLSADDSVAVINTNDHISTITIDVGAGVAGVGFELNYNPAELGLPVDAAPHEEITSSNPSVLCGVNVEGTIVCGGFAPSGDFVEDITIEVQFDIGAAEIPAPGSALTFSNANFTIGVDEVPATTTDGSVSVISAPPDLELVFDPEAGSTVTFPDGDAGSNVESDIDVSVTGIAGTATVSGCSVTGAGFSLISGDLTLGAGDTDVITVQCTLPASGTSTGTLSCDTEDDVNGAGTATWDLSCAEGNPVPIPEYSSTPVPGGDLAACDGAPGSTQETSLTISNTGNEGADSGFDYTCSTASPGFTVTGGAAGTLEVGDSATVTVQCIVPEEDAPANTGTLDCTSTAPNQLSAGYGLSSAPITFVPIPQPNVVPASSLWTQLALIGLLAGLGMLLIGSRRQ